MSATQRLIAEFRAARVSFTWLGVRKALTDEQRGDAAEAFGADSGYLSAGKKLFDTKHKAYRCVSSVKSRTATWWKSITLPFPEAGVRLIKEGLIPVFDAQMLEFRNDLESAVHNLDDHYYELRSRAKERLGSLYNPSDYPSALIGLFAIHWDFPNIEAPEYLRELNPELYEQEKRRVVARFDDAVRLAEDAFLDEFSKLVARLTERLSGGEDGQPKEFHDTTVTRLLDFFSKFRALNVGSSAHLETLISQAAEIVQGVTPKQLRGSSDLRRQVSSAMSGVSAQLDGMMIDRPRRRIDRRQIPVAAE